MANDSHLALQECSGLYVLGALGREDTAAFELHLANCDICAAEVRSLRETSASLPFSVPIVEPPLSLRERVLAAVGDLPTGETIPFSPRLTSAAAKPASAETSRSASLWVAWLSVAALALLMAGTGIYTLSLRRQLASVATQLADANARLQDSDVQLARARSDAAGVRQSLALLTSPDVLDLRLGGLAPAPQARGRALISRASGLLFAASGLPPLPPARVYQLWFLTTGAPVSAGLIQPDSQGTVTAAFDVPPSAPAPTGFAVSIEPEGGVPAPTGELYLATQ